MRACGACFWCPPRTHDREADTGECWNRPPIVIGVPGPPDEDGRVEVTITSVRPTVSLQEFCYNFSHHAEEKKRQAAADGQG